MSKYLITGGCGFLGSNIAAHLIRNNENVIIFDNLYRFGAEINLEWLKSQGLSEFCHGDIRSEYDVENVIAKFKPDIIFHLAGQVAMSTSLLNPLLDFEVNAKGSFYVLEAVRRYNPHAVIVYSSTNKVYGDLEYLKYNETDTRYEIVEYPRGIPENIALDFHSPYGCSKGSADQYMMDYHRMFGLNTVVFRHSSMCGGRQFSTYDQGWVGWFCQKAIEQSQGMTTPFTISGNGKQVRDIIYVEDMIELYLKAAEGIDKCKGHAFNIGGGMENSLSIIELLNFIAKELNTDLNYNHIAPRLSDQKVFVADNRKASEILKWIPHTGWETILLKMLDWEKNHG